MDFILFTDTDCDITPEVAKQYGYQLISMPYTLHGKEIKPYVDFKEFDYKAFYNDLRNLGKNELPFTSALSPYDYINYFEPFFKDGKDILYVHFSGAMSATFNALRLAEEELKEKYPDRKIHLIDTKGITVGSYSLCKQIGALANKGYSIEQLKKWADENVNKTGFYFYADDLKFFAKSGRVSGFAAFMGGIIGIKPIIYIGDSGTMQTKAKARGRKGALHTLLDYVKELQEDIKSYPVIIAHTDAEDIAKEFEVVLKKEFGQDLNVEIEVVNPTAGAHCGPNAMGVTFHAKHR